jgi:hypothetical protein
VVQGWAGRQSASLDPDDPESSHADRKEASPGEPDGERRGLSPSGAT